MRWVQDSHGHEIRLAWTNKIRDVEREGSLAAFVTSRGLTIDPDIRFVVHGSEPQQCAPALVRILRNVQRAPVPGEAVVAGKGVLDNPRHFRGDRFRSRSGEPLFGAPHILRIGGQQPIAVKRPARRDRKCLQSCCRRELCLGCRWVSRSQHQIIHRAGHQGTLFARDNRHRLIGDSSKTRERGNRDVTGIPVLFVQH